MQKKRRMMTLCLAILLIVTLISGARMIGLNQKWPQAQVIMIPQGAVLENEGIQWQIEDSVLGSVRDTLQHYGCENQNITESDVLDMQDYGWNGYVMAVKWKVTNNTKQAIQLEQVILADAESTQWANTYNFLAVDFYCENQKLIPAGESREYIYPYEVYQQHFGEFDWEHLSNRAFYLSRAPYYPQKVMLECTPTFLPSAQRVDKRYSTN